MKALRSLILGGCILLISACTNFNVHSEVEALNEAQAVGSPFIRALTDEYRAFANREMNEMFDYPDALHFARKGLAAAAGQNVMPEPISDWNLSPHHMQELGAARGRLILAFDMGGREIAPAIAARAQARFDCWIEEQEENWQIDDIILCKSEFLSAMNELEAIIGAIPTPDTEMAPPPATTVDTQVPTEPMRPEDAMYLVFFDFDRSNISAGGMSVLDAVADEIRSRSLSLVRIVGHTDSAGSASYNNRLAMRRANSVRDALLARGVDAALIQVEGRGQDDQLVQTADGVREPANRRAEITFE